jgi:hypothetical protein
VIRPFQVGDIFLIQRLGRQATKLTTIEALLNPQSAFQAALSAAILWTDAKVTTYILHQREHGLAGAGLLQVQKRPGRPEADILLLSPALDATWGHPAIWQKLLAHYLQEAPHHQITRIYADVPDQPLPVNTLSHVGFKVYTHETIWRLAVHTTELYTYPLSSAIRPQTKQDEWALRRLYHRITPGVVQQAEGMNTANAGLPPILEWWHAGMRRSYVLEQSGEVQGAVQIATGPRGVWLQLWADTRQPDSSHLHELARFGLMIIQQESVRLPVYIGISEHESVLGTILADYAFAPFVDRAKMVKHVVQWVRAVSPVLTPALEGIGEVVPTPYLLPEKSNITGA